MQQNHLGSLIKLDLYQCGLVNNTLYALASAKPQTPFFFACASTSDSVTEDVFSHSGLHFIFLLLALLWQASSFTREASLATLNMFVQYMLREKQRKITSVMPHQAIRRGNF